MQKTMRRFFIPATALFCSLGILMIFPVACPADVSVAGDTSPAAASISDAGGPIGGDLIIGNDGIAGLFMDIAPPLFDPLMPLQSTNGIIGNNELAIGAVTLEDFLGGDWIVDNDFTVGREGQAFLDLFDSASVTVGGMTVFGEEETGTGVSTVNGQGSRILTDGLIMGDLGFGQLTIRDRAILISGTAGDDSILGNQDGGVGIIEVTGVGSRWTVGNSTNPGTLTLGNAAGMSTLGTAQGTLKIANQALVQVSENVVINSHGVVNLEDRGRLRILPANSGTADAIVNRGVVSGSGFVDFVDHNFVISPIGEVRNSGNAIVNSLPTNQREKLIFTGTLLTNNGTIESLGGEMEFNVPVVNNLELIARDAVMRFPLGLTNNGVMILDGDTTIHGGITPAPLSNITVLPGSDVVVIGDLVFTSTSIVSLAIGDDAGTLSVSGMADLTGSPLLTLNYTGGASPQPGDMYEVFQAAGGITGSFLNPTAFAGGATWNIVQMGTSIFATFNALSLGPMGADFDGNGTVNNLDLAIWQANYGSSGSIGSLDALGDADSDGDVDGRDFSRWQREFGGPGVEPFLAAVAVPEPSGLILLLSAGLLAVRSRAKS